jgi:predicted ATP-dependent protease
LYWGKKHHIKTVRRIEVTTFQQFHTEIIGQPRAVEALELGLNMRSPGFNLYVSGPVGTGKGTLVRQMVKRLAQAAPAPSDWCYVNNFQDPSRPICLALLNGQGASFKRDMSAFIDGLRRDIPLAFESKTYLDAKAKLRDEIDSKKKSLFQELTELSRTRGFGFEETSVGFGIVPLKAGKPMTDTDIEAMTDEEQQDLNERRRALEGEIREFHVRIHGLEREAEHQLRHLDRQLVTSIMENHYATMWRTYQVMGVIASFLERVRNAHRAPLQRLSSTRRPAIAIPGLEFRRPDMSRFLVNLIVQQDPTAGIPVIDESHPTYTNLIGKIERRAHMGVMYTDSRRSARAPCCRSTVAT